LIDHEKTRSINKELSLIDMISSSFFFKMRKGGRPSKIDKEKIIREFVLNPPIPNPPRERRPKLSEINDMIILKKTIGTGRRSEGPT
jgi:hypothetical protein